MVRTSADLLPETKPSTDSHLSQLISQRAPIPSLDPVSMMNSGAVSSGGLFMSWNQYHLDDQDLVNDHHGFSDKDNWWRLRLRGGRGSVGSMCEEGN